MVRLLFHRRSPQPNGYMMPKFIIAALPLTGESSFSENNTNSLLFVKSNPTLQMTKMQAAVYYLIQDFGGGENP